MSNNQSSPEHSANEKTYRTEVEVFELVGKAVTDNEYEIRYASAAGETVSEDRDVPIYFEGGFGVSNPPNLAEIARNGRDAFSLEINQDQRMAGFVTIPLCDDGATAADNRQPTILTNREAIAWHFSSPESRRGYMLLSIQQIWRATRLIDAMDKADIEQIDAIPQSGAGFHLWIAAFLAPQRFRNIVAAFPTGLTPPDLLPEATARVIVDPLVKRLRTLVRPEPGRFDVPEGSSGRYVKNRPSRADLYSGPYISLSDQAPLVHRLRQHPDAPTITVLAADRDMIIRPEKVVRSLRSPSDIDRLIVIPGTHGISGNGATMSQLVALTADNIQLDEAAKTKPLRDRIVLPSTMELDRQRRICELADNVPLPV